MTELQYRANLIQMSLTATRALLKGELESEACRHIILLIQREMGLCPPHYV